ncbi:MAG: CHAP domain-containing protein [Bacteroidota bacterium]
MSTTYAPAHYGTTKQWIHKDPWCASFVNWCFNQVEEYKGINTKGNGAAFDWGPYESKKTNPSKGIDGWKDGEETEPFVGAIIVLDYAHVAFIVGKNSNLNRYVYLGGNQGSNIPGKQQIKYGTVSVGSEFAIMKPKKYKVQSYELPELNKNEDGSYESSR